MGLFGSKKMTPQQPTLTAGELTIQKIPDIFYGGNNPVIYEPAQEKAGGTVGSRTTAATPRPSFPQATDITKQRSRLLWIIPVLGVVVIAGASVYYFFQYQSIQDARRVAPSGENTRITQTVSSSPIVPVITTASTTIDQVPTTTPALSSNFLEFPLFNVGNTADADLDQLTDIEEVLYGIDSGTWDTDQDGYYDGQEVINLYSPRGGAPMKLIDSGLVREYINQFSGYRLYYPIQWNQGGVDLEEKHMLFSSISGEYIEVRVFSKAPGVTFAQWFQANAPGEQFNLLSTFSNRFGVEGWKRNDGLVVYFDTPSFVFTVIYHQLESATPIPYRTTMEMVYQSFRPTATTRTIPDQVPLVVPSNTTSSNTSTP